MNEEICREENGVQKMFMCRKLYEKNLFSAVTTTGFYILDLLFLNCVGICNVLAFYNKIRSNQVAKVHRNLE